MRSIQDGRLNVTSQLFYEFHPGDAVPENHLVRKIDHIRQVVRPRTSGARDLFHAPTYGELDRPADRLDDFLGQNASLAGSNQSRRVGGERAVARSFDLVRSCNTG